ncbi:hypothetical protein S40293_09643 [Stachybotrys chartarum IBT 40293]|nr:hypothetical protein S40293_09643 [Stachybotrys chartarum IBT 40293]
MESGIKEENTWNCDEIGFMVGYLQRGGFAWTFNEIEKPELMDSHDLVSVTAVEAVSATGKSIPTFLIIPGTNIPVYFIQNDLEDDTVITMSFGKTDFLYHLQEIRNRTFKESTIRSAWRKCGLFLYNPSIVLDQLRGALSSLTEDVNERDLPGYITMGSKESSEEDSEPLSTPTNRSSNSMNFRARTPETTRIIRQNPSTPPYNMRIIQKYNTFVLERIESSVISEQPLTPTVKCVFEKAQKVRYSLALNRITTTREMRLLKEKGLKRTQYQEDGRIVAKHGPITVGDARLRAAKDTFNRLAAQEDEEERIAKKAARGEAAFLRRWISKVRHVVRESIIYTKKGEAGNLAGYTKKHYRDYLKGFMPLSAHYCFLRELRFNSAYDTDSIMTWPEDYEPEVITAAIKLMVAEKEQRTANRRKLQLEADGIEVTAKYSLAVMVMRLRVSRMKETA